MSRSIGPTLVSGRPLEEYLAMFALAREQLRELRVLDCPSGAASFVAEHRQLGGSVVGIDPVYAGGKSGLGRAVLEEARRGQEYVAANEDAFVWEFFPNPAAHWAFRERAVRSFADDLATPGAPYVGGALPDLPFADNSFDLALSSHLLFTYGDRFGESFHRRSLVELLRVAAEVRVFPLVDHATKLPYEHLESLLGALEGDAVVERRQVAYEFEPGADEVLILRRR